MATVCGRSVARLAAPVTVLRCSVYNEVEFFFAEVFEMKKVCFLAFALVLVVGSLVLGSHASTVSIRGDYVEVRTASVFAGACHYNGEVTTTGRDAIMAWNVTSGQLNGVDVAGVRVVAVVTADANLGERNAARRSEIIVGKEASHAQATAIVNAIKTKYASSLGEIVSVRSEPVTFDRQGATYAVGTDVVSMNVEAMPNDLCCKMPNLVWYQPLVSVENRKVGYTKKAIYAGDALTEPWQRSGENSAFYGTFAF
jgi:hypothetical protein